MQHNDNKNQFFDQLKESILNIDIVNFCERYLTLDGKQFTLRNNGYAPFASIYRYLSTTALQKNSKPVVLVKGRQVGATTMAAALELYFGCSGLFGNNGRPHLRVLHTFPLQNIAEAYTKEKLNTMISGAKVIDENANKSGKCKTFIQSKIDNSSPSNDSISYKKFLGGSIHICYTGEDGNRLRSYTVDALFCDEIQDTSFKALGNIEESLTKAQYGNEGVRCYFGTPKRHNSDYFKVWKASSQQYFYLFCEKCEQHFPLYLPDGEKNDSWEKIWIEDDLPKNHPNHGFIVRCPHCQHEQDKIKAAEKGKWVAQNLDENCKYIGFHINQLYDPTKTRKSIIAKKPENHETNTPRKYQNEVLGEWWDGSSTPITPEIIIQMCAERNRSLISAIPQELGKNVYLGLDWGKKNDDGQGEKGESKKTDVGKSYSSAVVLTADGPQLLSVQFARLLQKNNADYKKQLVEEMMHKFSVKIAVSDIGYAEDLNEKLHLEYPDRFFCSRASGSKINGHVRFKEDNFPKEIEFEKDYYLGIIFKKFEQGQIKLPFSDYDKIMWLVNQCASMDTKFVKDRAGNIVREMYVKGSIPNDGLMSLLNAYLAYLFDITNHFKINNPAQMSNQVTNNRPQIISAYIPR